MNANRLLLQKEVYAVFGCAIEVLNVRGHDLPEKTDENCLCVNHGNFVGIDDHHLQFDQFGTRIAYEIEDLVLPANAFVPVLKNVRQNPRWLSERFAWSWSSVFH
jgi:hypothetical protein